MMKSILLLVWVCLGGVRGMDIPLVSLRGEDGREYSTTDFERLDALSPPDSLHPRMPFKMPPAL